MGVHHIGFDAQGDVGGQGGVHAATCFKSEGIIGGQACADSVAVEVRKAAKTVHKDCATTEMVGVLRASEQDGGVLGVGVVGAILAKHFYFCGEAAVRLGVEGSVESVEYGVADGWLRGVIERAREEGVPCIDLGPRIRNSLWLAVILCAEASAGSEGKCGDESEQRTAKRHVNILQMFDAVGDRLHTQV